MPTEKAARISREFYSALAAALELAGADVCAALLHGIIAPRWHGGRVDLSGPPFRVRVRWNPADRPRKQGFTRRTELGAADEQALLGMVPDLVAFLIAERIVLVNPPDPDLRTRQRFFREVGAALSSAGIPWRVLTDGFFLYVEWADGKALLDHLHGKWYIDVDAGGKRFSLEPADEHELLAYIPRLVAFAGLALSARELAGAARIR
jgi:hypothetical protein